MQYSDDRYHLRVEFDTRQCEVPPEERAHLQRALVPLAGAVRDFPSSELTVRLIHHPRSDAFHADFRLRLPGQTLFADEWDDGLQPAFERCVRKLVPLVEAYRAKPDAGAEEVARRQSALRQNFLASEERDDGPLGRAVRDGDYKAFRTAASVYEEWLRKRVGRWVQRFPDAQARVGRGLAIGDLVEAVFLNAFEGYDHRPTQVPLHEWLDGLIDPSLKELLNNPDEARQNVSLARTLRQTPMGRK